MKKFFALFLLLITASLFADDPKIRLSGEMKTKYEYIDMNVFMAQLKYGARYQYENLEVVAEIKAKYSLCVYYDSMQFDIERSYFTYAFTDYLFATVGRENLRELFESKVQYGSKFNGAAIGLDLARLSVKAAASIPGQEGYYTGCAQVQLQPFDFPFKLAYSASYWASREDICDEYMISQISAKVSPFKKFPLILSIGWLINDRQENNNISEYVSVEVGNPYPENKGDWQVAVTARKMGVNTIPCIDRRGICNGCSGTGIALEAIYSASDRLSFKGRVEIDQVDQSVRERVELYEMSAICKF